MSFVEVIGVINFDKKNKKQIALINILNLHILIKTTFPLYSTSGALHLDLATTPYSCHSVSQIDLVLV